MSEPWILGVSYSHNGAACLLRGSELVVAIQEERVTGVKRARLEHYRTSLAVAYCLDTAGISLDDVELVVAAQFTAGANAVGPVPDARLPVARRYMTMPHHRAHARAVLATSGYSDAAVLVIDGQGGAIDQLPAEERTQLVRGVVPGATREAEVVSIYAGRDGELVLREKHTGDWLAGYGETKPAAVPRCLLQFGSIGGLYAAVSALIFDDVMAAGKVMGLAPYGRGSSRAGTKPPMFPVDAFFTIAADGSFHYSDRLIRELGELAPWPSNDPVLPELAASAQHAVEHAVLHLARRARELTGSNRLCYAGGVALNGVANERIVRELGFAEVYVMPAAEDSGPAIGAAYEGLASLGTTRPARRLEVDSVGKRYTPREIDDAVARVPFIEAVDGEPLDHAVALLQEGRILGWFEGGSELGPRALGARSILCDPRRPDAKAMLNDRIKHREGFRPFAPVVLREEAHRWFDMTGDSPHMLRVCRVREDRVAQIPAVVHVDNTARVQTATAVNGRLYTLLQRFFAATGVPMLLNTSFNVAGEPIVESPEDALWCLLATGLDAVVFEHTVVRKAAPREEFSTRSSATVLLALRPRVHARELRVATAIVDGAIPLSPRADSDVQLIATTPLGEVSPRIRASDLRLLALCDGSRTGAEILDALSRASSAPLDETWLVRRLHQLRRAHILTLRP